jgi:hypothetical protein
METINKIEILDEHHQTVYLVVKTHPCLRHSVIVETPDGKSYTVNTAELWLAAENILRGEM